MWITLFFTLSCSKGIRSAVEKEELNNNLFAETIENQDDTTKTLGRRVREIINDSGVSVVDTIPLDSMLLAQSLDSLKIKTPKKSAFESEVKYKAEDSLMFDVENRIIYLYGKAEISFETINLKADLITVDLKNQNIFATFSTDSLGNKIGKPVFTDADKSFTAENLKYNFQTKKGIVNKVITQEADGFLHGEIVKYSEEVLDNDTVKVIYVKQGKYTTCNLEEPHFHISANKIKVIPGKKIITGPANVVIERVPTPLFLPFGFFPNNEKRASGILPPQYGQLNDLGFFLREGGYYWAMSQYADLAVTGSIYSNGSWGNTVASNYNKRYKFNGSVSGSFTNRISGTDPQIASEFFRQRDFSFRWTHIQDPKARPNSTFKSDVNIQSTDFNRFNTTNINAFVQNTFQSNISYFSSIPSSPFNYSVNLTHSQNTQTGAVDLGLPEFAFNTSRFFPFKNRKSVGPKKWYREIYEGIGVTHRTDFSNRVSTSDSTFINDLTNAFAGKLRNGIRHTAQVNNTFKLAKYINVVPGFNYTEYWNFRQLNRFFNNETQTGDTTITQGFFTDREWNLNTSFSTNVFTFIQFRNSKIKAIRHMMTPTIQLVYRPDFSPNVTGFVGPGGALTTFSRNALSAYPGPGVGQQGLVSFGVTNNIEMKVKSNNDTLDGEKKIKILDVLSFNGNYNLLADSFNLSFINIQARNAFFNNRLNVNFSANLDPYHFDSLAAIPRRVNRFEINESGSLARISDANINFSFSLVGRRTQPLPAAIPNSEMQSELDMIRNNLSDYLDFNIPYSLNIAYNIRYANINNVQNITNSFQINGDFTFTKNWKVNFNTGFDFQNRQVTTTSIGIFRDLHCWQMDLQWIPFGFIRSYVFTIRPKSSLLQDLKLTRRRGFTGI